MKDVEEFYILGLPIETEAGIIRPLTVTDYVECVEDLYAFSFTKNFIIYRYMKINKDGSLDKLIEELNNSSLIEIVFGLSDLKASYMKIFEKSFESDDYFHKLNESNFESVRKTILRINCTHEEDAFLNLEIQAAVERSKRVKNQENIDFSDIISSIVAYTGIDYSVIKNWTLYQVYTTYGRIGQFKNYDTTTLFATVAEKVNIESWNKHLDLFKKDKHFTTHDEFKKSTAKAVQ